MCPSEGTQRKKKADSGAARGVAPTILLRTFQMADFETLWAIDQVCYEPGIAYSRRELKNYLSFPGADCVVAETQGAAAGESGRKIIGFCVTAQRGEWGYIVTIDVLAEARRHGVGSKLLEEIERRMAQRGVKEIALETATDNEAGIAFWKKHAYRNRGVRKGYYPGGRDAYSMVKELA